MVEIKLPRTTKIMRPSGEGALMMISVVLKDGQKRRVTRDELQFLITTKQLKSFRRTNGWVVIGQDEMRHSRNIEYSEKDRRKQSIYLRGYWY